MVQSTPELIWCGLWESSPSQMSPLSSWQSGAGEKKSLKSLSTSAGKTKGVSPVLYPRSLCTVPSPSPYITYPGAVANKRAAYVQHAPGARRHGGQGEQGPGTWPRTLMVSLTEMRPLPYRSMCPSCHCRAINLWEGVGSSRWVGHLFIGRNSL